MRQRSMASFTRQIELRNPALPLDPPELDDHIYGVPDVFPHLGKCQRRPCLQHHDRQPVDGQFRGFSVDG